MHGTFNGDGHGALQAMNRDLAEHFVRWKRVAGPKHDTHDLKVVGLEQCRGTLGG